MVYIIIDTTASILIIIVMIRSDILFCDMSKDIIVSRKSKMKCTEYCCRRRSREEESVYVREEFVCFIITTILCVPYQFQSTTDVKKSGWITWARMNNNRETITNSLTDSQEDGQTKQM